MIKSSKKPFILVGGGAVISDAAKEVRELAELVDAPVCDSLMGKGAMDGNSERYTGMIGMHGTKTSNFGVTMCDLLLVLGARFSDRVIGKAKAFANNAKIVHIDVDPSEINKNIKADASIIGDMKEVLIRLNSALTKQDHADWMQEIKEMKEKYPLALNKDVLTGPAVIDSLYNITMVMLSLQQMLDSIRCGLHSSISLKNLDSLLLQVDLVQWAMVLVHVLVLRWAIKTEYV